ncbi:MAG: hypothetical protein COA79_09825 [Planctomycetota bacterium]|nr:MAG: hypothetical protein COA79_09825 [Planctomycetota bacterium]
MLKKIPFLITFFIHLILLTDGFCDTTEVFNSPVDKKNEIHLNAVMKKIQSKKIIIADFKQIKKMVVLHKPLLSSGKFIFIDSKGICWQTEKPFKVSFVITKQKMIQIEKGKVTLDISMDKQPLIHGMTNVFKSMFNGNLKELKKHFSLFYKFEKNKWTLGLKPKKNKMKRFFKSIVLQGELYIDNVMILEQNTDITTIEFNNHKNPKKLTTSELSVFEK